MDDWLQLDATALWAVPVSAAGIYVAVILFTRLNGLRSFSTMSGFDFAMTIAVGSLMATTLLNPRPTLLEGAMGLATLYVLQRSVSVLRRRSRWFKHIVDNEPALLVHKGRVLEHNMKQARVAREDLHAKLREAGIARMQDVEAVVLETTGTFSVVPRTEEADEFLLSGVKS